MSKIRTIIHITVALTGLCLVAAGIIELLILWDFQDEIAKSFDSGTMLIEICHIPETGETVRLYYNISNSVESWWLTYALSDTAREETFLETNEWPKLEGLQCDPDAIWLSSTNELHHSYILLTTIRNNLTATPAYYYRGELQPDTPPTMESAFSPVYFILIGIVLIGVVMLVVGLRPL